MKLLQLLGLIALFVITCFEGSSGAPAAEAKVKEQQLKHVPYSKYPDTDTESGFMGLLTRLSRFVRVGEIFPIYRNMDPQVLDDRRRRKKREIRVGQPSRADSNGGKWYREIDVYRGGADKYFRIAFFVNGNAE